MSGSDEAAEVVEVVPGDYEVRLGGRVVRVLVPAGVGIPGVDESDLAGALIEELMARGVQPPEVVDVSSLLRTDPGLLHAVAERADLDTPDA